MSGHTQKHRRNHGRELSSQRAKEAGSVHYQTAAVRVMRNKSFFPVSNYAMRLHFTTALLSITFALTGGVCAAQAGNDGFRCPGRELAPRPTVKTDLGNVTKKALYLPRPKYPELAKRSGIYGSVTAQVVISINSGRVVWAFVVSGHPSLKSAVSDVVCKARFAPIYDADGFVNGFITYRFARRANFLSPT